MNPDTPIPNHERNTMNTDTPTPRTDASVKRHNLCRLSGNDLVYADFPRQLERELAAVTEQRDYMTLRLGETQERMIDAERQRDRLAEAQEELTAVTEQRDEWKAKYIQQNKDLGYNLPWIDFAR